MNFETSIRKYNEKHGSGRAFSPKAVLFDMDGVLYDSMSHHANAWVKMMHERGINMTIEDAYRHEGMRGVETIHQIAIRETGKDISDETSKEWYAVKSQYFADQGHVDKMEGVEDLMHKIVADGLLIGVVTGSGQLSLLNHLEAEFPGLVFRERMVTANDVTIGKPNPAPYLKGLRKCGVQPHEAIVVENAPLGVRAAVAAGIFTVAVNTGPLKDEDLLCEGANILFRRMTHFRDQWEELLATAHQIRQS